MIHHTNCCQVIYYLLNFSRPLYVTQLESCADRTLSDNEDAMATLHLICGLPGSGKTTLAKQLERDLPALRLAPDEWMARIVGDGFDDAKRAAVEAVQWEIAARALSLGINVSL